MLPATCGCDGRTSSFSQTIEGFDSFFAEFLNVSFDTFGSHNKRLDDLDLFACSLTSELGSKHSKRGVVALVMKEDRLDAAKICPAASSTNDADSIVQGCSPIGDQG